MEHNLEIQQDNNVFWQVLWNEADKNLFNSNKVFCFFP